MGLLKVLCLALVLGAATAMEYWREEMLKRENAHRADHGSPPMTYSSLLQTRAQEWAEHLTGICDYYIVDPHAPQDEKKAPGLFIDGKKQGENIQRGAFMGNYPNLQKEIEDGAIGGVGAWYGEIKDYPFGDFDGQNNPKMIFHFSQMVWKSTKEVGYGLSSCNGTDKEGKPLPMFFSVARYFPGGNVVMIGGPNQFKENVHPKQ